MLGSTPPAVEPLTARTAAAAATAALRVQVKFRPHADPDFFKGFPASPKSQGSALCHDSRRGSSFSCWLKITPDMIHKNISNSSSSPTPDDLRISDEGSSVVAVGNLHPDTVWGPYLGVIQSEGGTENQEMQVKALNVRQLQEPEPALSDLNQSKDVLSIKLIKKGVKDVTNLN